MAKANVKARGNQKIGPEAYYRHLKGLGKALKARDLKKAQHHQVKLNEARSVG